MGDAFEPVHRASRGAGRGGAIDLWIRRAALGLLLAVTVLALCNVFGQRASSAGARNASADLTVHSPRTVRAGLLFQARFTIVAHRTLPAASLVLGSGWIDGLTLNTGEPSPTNETSGPGGSLKFDIGKLDAGETYTEYLEYQVNPTSSSSRTQLVTVESAGAPVVSLHRTMTILP
jgi:hypothetical protein